MEYKNYSLINREKMNGIISRDELSLDKIYEHFLEYDDECIYVVDGESLAGVVSVSDWQKAYVSKGKKSCVNTQFSYLEEVDFEGAERLILKIRKIHEVPVIKNGKFIGIIVNGERKRQSEWTAIRRDNKAIKYGHDEWEKEQLEQVFTYVRPKVYVYLDFDMKKLAWDNKDIKILMDKAKYPCSADGLAEMSESEQRDFFGERYSEEYVREFIDNFRKLTGSRENGITRINDIRSRHYNVTDGYRELPGYARGGAKKRIYIVGACMMFGAYVSDDQTIEYYLYRILQEHHIYDYEVVNAGLMDPTSHFPASCPPRRFLMKISLSTGR